MKKLSLWMLVFPILMLSCTSEEELKEIDSLSKTSSTSMTQRPNLGSTEDIISIENEIDNLLSVFYDESNFDDASIAAVNEAIQSTGNITVNLSSGSVNVTNSSINDVREVVSNSKGTVIDITIVNSLMSLPAKTSLENFIENVIQFNNGNYVSMINSIELYESAVAANNTYSSQDKVLMRNTTLIAKTSLFYEARRKDKDWETSVGNKDEDFIPTDELTFKIVRMALLAGTTQITP